MADFKVTWKFVGNDGSEWNEQFYVGGASSATAAAKPSPALLTIRLSVLNKLNKLRAVVASDVLGTRNTVPNVLNLNGTEAVVPPLGGPAPRDQAVVLNLVGQQGSKRKLWLRGFTLGDMFLDTDSGFSRVQAAFGLRLIDLYAGWRDNGYGIRKLTPITNPALQTANVTNIDAQTRPGMSLLTLDHALVVVPGTASGRIIISRANRKDTPGLNGVYSVVAVAGAVVTIPYVPPRALNVTGDIGRAKVQAFNAIDIFDPAACSIDHYGAHDTKVPLSHSRGARRAQRIRQLA